MEMIEMVLWYTITIVLADEQTSTNARGLHLRWKSQSGRSFEFDGVRVTWPNMHILEDGQVLASLVHMTIHTQPREVEQLLKNSGFMREADAKRQAAPQEGNQVWSYEQFSALAQEYDIQLLVDESDARTLVTSQHNGHVYKGDEWAVLQHHDEACVRLHFAGIVGESKRPGDLTAHLRDLLTRAQAGDQAARQQMVERNVMHIKQAYHISNLALLQQVRVTLLDGLDDALRAPYPLEDLDERAHRVVHALPLQLYDILRPWQDSVYSLHGDVVQAVMNYYRQ